MMSIFGGLAQLGNTYLQGKLDESKAKSDAAIIGIQADADIKKAKALAATNMATSGQAQDYDLDRMAMEQMSKSWKDELLLVIFLAPMVMSFIPSLSAYALEGFTVIEKMPEWYRYTILGMVIVIYGLRGMVKQLVTKRLGQLPSKE